MYRPKHYSETDRKVMTAFMHDHPFATIIANDGSRSYATQVPVMISENENGILVTGHVSRFTDHFNAMQEGSELLILFTGPHCYVSASWYNGPVSASTWNYMAVQARGMLHLLNKQETLEVIKALTDQYENGREHAAYLENMSGQYVQDNLKAICGFSVTITDLQATFKLSQNRPDDSYYNIVQQLLEMSDEDSKKIAGELMSRRPHLFE